MSKGKGRGRKPSVKAKAGRLSPLPDLELIRVLERFPTALPKLELLLGARFGGKWMHCLSAEHPCISSLCCGYSLQEAGS